MNVLAFLWCQVLYEAISPCLIKPEKYLLNLTVKLDAALRLKKKKHAKETCHELATSISAALVLKTELDNTQSRAERRKVWIWCWCTAAAVLLYKNNCFIDDNRVTADQGGGLVVTENKQDGQEMTVMG